ncbi:MAG: DUF2059 domain-containing protein [Burkholderiales bacterium]|nr:DUF2059 domain-containing protein [Burkholderiales bacterium]
MMLIRSIAATALALATGLCAAQGAPSQAKKDLVQRVLTLQHGALEGVGNTLAGETANRTLQAAAQAMGRVPADKREAVGNEVKAEVRKFYEEIAPILRDRAVKAAPSTIGTALEEKFSEDELKVLSAWLESPVSKKFQQLAGEMQQTLVQRTIADSRSAIEPKLKALEQTLSKKMGLPTEPAGKASAPATSAKPAGTAASPAKK